MICATMYSIIQVLVSYQCVSFFAIKIFLHKNRYIIGISCDTVVHAAIGSTLWYDSLKCQN